MKNKAWIFIIIFSFIGISIEAQIPNTQDCLGAIPVCQNIYTENTAPIGEGNYPGEAHPGSCISGEDNGIWYTFTVSGTGNFGFLLTPNDLDDDYDWALYDITNSSCDKIKSDISLGVSCNASGGQQCHGPTGATGDSNYDVQGAGCNSLPPNVNFGFSPFNDLVPVIDGHTYVLMVANWTGSTNGYTIDFGISDVQIFDVTEPTIADIELPDICGDDEITIFLSENVICSSFDIANITLEGPFGPVDFTAFMENCENGASYDNSVTVVADEFFKTGIYTFSICCLEDNCGNILDVAEIVFDADNLKPQIDLGPDQVICEGNSLILDASFPESVVEWQDGSQDPIYELNQEGLYIVYIENQCGNFTDSVTVTFSGDTPIDIDLGEDQLLCEGQSLLLDATYPGSTYMWQDGSMNASFNVVSDGLFVVQMENSCGEFRDSLWVEYTSLIDIDLGSDRTICMGDSIFLDASFYESTYLWQDGSTNEHYLATEEGVYHVLVQNICGEESDSLMISFVEEIDIDLGEDQILCEGDTIILDASFEGSSYMWQDGFSGPIYYVSDEGKYRVELRNECQEFVDSMQVSVIESIAFNLGEVGYFCEEKIVLDPGFPDFILENTELIWQNGSTDNTFEVTMPGEYWLQASTICETYESTIEILPCEFCDIYIPTIFSPNNDGVNERFEIFSNCELFEFELYVFDRWGNMVCFLNDKSTRTWNGQYKGRDVMSGVYKYVLNYTYTANGIDISNEDAGSISIIR